MLSMFSGLLLFVVSGCSKKENPFPDHLGGKTFQGLNKADVKCSGCHGDLGGGGMSGPSMTKAAKKMTPKQFVGTVLNGRGGMPAFEGMLEKEEILEIVDWLKKLPE